MTIVKYDKPSLGEDHQIAISRFHSLDQWS